MVEYFLYAGDKLQTIKTLVNPMKEYDTRPGSVAEWLEQALMLHNCPVAKCMNNLSAYSLVHGCPLTEHMKVRLSSPLPLCFFLVCTIRACLGSPP